MDKLKEFWSELSTEQKIKYILIALGSLIVLVFILQNLDVVKIQLFNLSFKMPLVLIIIFAMGFGYLLSLMINYRKIHGLKKERTQLKKELNQPNVSSVKSPSEDQEKSNE